MPISTILSLSVACGIGHLDLVAHLLAHEPLADRAGQQDLVLVVVLVARADQDEVLFLVELEVQHPDLRAEDDPIGAASWSCRR